MPTYESGYTGGEAAALLAPLAGADPADVAEWTVVMITDHEDGPAIHIGSSDDDNRRIVRMLAAAIIELAGDAEDES